MPVILGEHVTTEAGTGAVHTAPGHGADDFEMGQAYDLPLENPVGDDGRFLPGTERFAGLFVYDANHTIVEAAAASAARCSTSSPTTTATRTAGATRRRSSSAPRRSGSSTWTHERPARADPGGACRHVRWFPDWGEERMASMVRNRPEWCISRQRNWGVPIALFVDRETGEPHPETDRLIEAVARRMDERGIDAWFELEPEELLGDEAARYEKVTDILDVWFDSGVTHASVLEPPTGAWPMPADLYLEGSDQYRGWFQSSLLTGDDAMRRRAAVHGRAHPRLHRGRATAARCPSPGAMSSRRRR
ncbi:MAG: class I tRNA ligase family protein [Arhodomonas sp.]|nr:class I tRNA ligase family protein [Arhodomonas sp.]